MSGTRLVDRVLFDRLSDLYALAMPPADGTRLRTGLSLADGPVERGIDLGGGPGRAATAVGEVDWTVVDRSEGMVQAARRRGHATARGDATRLPLADGAVDAVVVVDALHHMPDHPAVLAEVARVLRPGGVVVVREFDPSTLPGRALVAGERAVGFGSTFHSPDALASALDDAGLSPTVLEDGFDYTVAGVA